MRVVKPDGLGNEGGKVSVCNSIRQSHPTGSHNKLACETLVKWMPSVNHDSIHLSNQQIGISFFHYGSHVAQIFQHEDEFIMPKMVIHHVSYSFDSLINEFLKTEHVIVCGKYVNL